ncbi:MAG TPA: nitronate monooxygenase [Solirubrobacter sp.]|jgi:nitronate monooxygenase|nr:nitronate monooxygenase [Solirubrobacter sp.]
MSRVSRLLNLEYPIVQGPFGGGLSRVALAAAVSEAGGLGSYGMHHLGPAEIRATAERLHAATSRPFALNLWVSTHDLPEPEMTRERFDAAVRRLQPLYDEAGAAPPPYPERFGWDFERQAEAVLAARPAAFSFVFGVPDERILAAFRDAGIVTLGTATTPDEAVALDRAGVDIIVASGAEAGGHRGAFLAEAEASLVGTLPLVRIAVSEVGAPVIAAGGIADAKGIAAALALGAEGVQIGTAFLATDESGARDEHKAALRAGARRTTLTRAFSGRLARGIPNRLTETDAFEPYPYQSHLLAPLARTEFAAMWCGQGAPLVAHRSAAALFAALTEAFITTESTVS